MRIRAGFLAASFALIPGVGMTQGPMSAIDWLSNSVTMPIAAPAPQPLDEPAATGVALPEVITVTPLDEVSADAVGLVPANISGLPRNLWGTTASTELAGLFASARGGHLPAMQDLLLTLLMTELDPPSDSNANATLFLARVDTLLALGAVEQAQVLLERAGPDDPERFRRWFDASLLTGTEDRACDRLRHAPGLSPTIPTRIFCLARGGDWNAAALTLETSRALGQTTEAEDALMARFLDPTLFEGEAPLPVPTRPSPLIFRLYEAIGEALPTTTLPLAFAHADLQPNTGWKSQLEAAERLARSGALPANKLLGLYTERSAAASGGVWDRVSAVQRFESALQSGSAEKIADALISAWSVLQPVELETVFAKLSAKRLQAVTLPGYAGTLAYHVALLSDDYEIAAVNHTPANGDERFLKAVAQGDMSSYATGFVPPNEMARAIADGFLATEAPPRLGLLVKRGELGAAILRAAAMTQSGAQGNLGDLTAALALFRSVGLEDVARRAALQVMILDRRG